MMFKIQPQEKIRLHMKKLMPIYFPVPVFEKIAKIAELNNKPRTEVVNEMVKYAISNMEEK